MIKRRRTRLIGAVERTMGAALRQRCLVHRATNILAKVGKNAQLLARRQPYSGLLRCGA